MHVLEACYMRVGVNYMRFQVDYMRQEMGHMRGNGDICAHRAETRTDEHHDRLILPIDRSKLDFLPLRVVDIELGG